MSKRKNKKERELWEKMLSLLNDYELERGFIRLAEHSDQMRELWSEYSLAKKSGLRETKG